MSDRERRQRLIREDIQAMTAYPVPPAEGLRKLDAMENPYAWPDAMRDAWLGMLREVPLNRYPDPRGRDLVAALRTHLGLDDAYDVLLGNGSDELIQVLALALAKPGAVLLAPEPGFVMYRTIATLAGLDHVGVDLTPDFQLDRAAMLEAIQHHRPAVVFLACPNNPTGTLFDEADVRAVIEAAPGLVVIDEAYEAFTDRNSLSLLTSYAHVLVMRTLSKVGLAGLRLGFLVGAPDWLHELDKVRLPYNVNGLTQATATFALTHDEPLREQARVIRAARETLYDALTTIPGVSVWPSEANFLLFRVPAGQARTVHTGLREAGVLIKCLDGAHPLLHDCLRVTVGDPADNEAFLTALRNLL